MIHVNPCSDQASEVLPNPSGKWIKFICLQNPVSGIPIKINERVISQSSAFNIMSRQGHRNIAFLLVLWAGCAMSWLQSVAECCWELMFTWVALNASNRCDIHIQVLLIPDQMCLYESKKNPIFPMKFTESILSVISSSAVHKDIIYLALCADISVSLPHQCDWWITNLIKLFSKNPTIKDIIKGTWDQQYEMFSIYEVKIIKDLPQY